MSSSSHHQYRVDPHQRRTIVRSCKSRGWTVHPEALALMDEQVEALKYNGSAETTAEALSTLLDGLRPHLKGSRTVTEQVWNDWVEASQPVVATNHNPANSNNISKSKMPTTTTPTSSSSSLNLQVVQAFQTPKLVFQGMRRQFLVEDPSTGSLLGSAEDKINMLAQRYALIHQRVLRHKIFRPSSSDWYPASSSLGKGQAKITPIESLLGQKSNMNDSSMGHVILLGILLQIEQGAYYLEDPTGQVPVSLQNAEPTDASFLTEHSILLVEGSVQDGIVHVRRISQPLQETRVDALKSIQQQVSHPAFMLPKSTMANGSNDDSDDTTFCIFQDVHMDQPRVLQQLESVLAHHEHRSASMTTLVSSLPVFVFMGNFCSPHALQAAAAPTPAARQQLIKSALDELLALLAKFPTLAAHAHFVIVPGPRDSGNRVLPIPPLSTHNMPHHTGSSHKAAVAHVHWASNPCRLRYNKREMVIFRHDLLPLLLQHQIHLPSEYEPPQTMDEDGSGSNDDMDHVLAPTSRLLKTVLDQGTLMPLTSVVPVYWNYSHALALYPLPDCLVLGSGGGGSGHNNNSTQNGTFDSYVDCHILQTSSFAHQHSGAYSIYRPGGSTAVEDDEDSSMDSDEEATSPKLVEFVTANVPDAKPSG